ncbi:UDP-glucose 4-epimerase GalE [Brassicibacter mesophilus]|uniref:UDP-glucose 4-epimerase GalE n=1 Tax=Brassicibacter mesophilus TaxID=745119 RepID=UPI003D261768
MSILVTGGAGYIGSHTVLELLNKGEEVIVVDSLYKGHKDSVLGGKLYVGDIRDGEFLDKVFKENDIEGVIHFAADSLVGESMNDPFKYYHNNVYGTLMLLDKMKEKRVDKIVFSSTAATYGEPENIPILESDKTEPTNTYGETKLSMEKMMKWFNKGYGIRYTALRYFNAAGADESGKIGEDHIPETHLIPIIFQVALGKKEKILIYGDDYDTKDGTCVRDYIHVSDLAQAHILAFEKMRNGGDSSLYNLGSGSGITVKEVIDTVRMITGHSIPTEMAQRRVGDPAVLIASSDKIKAELGWTPKYDNLGAIIQTAWNWHKNNPNGFRK